ncbi:unnamed protein product [Urochloa humidicola]
MWIQSLFCCCLSSANPSFISVNCGFVSACWPLDLSVYPWLIGFFFGRKGICSLSPLFLCVRLSVAPDRFSGVEIDQVVDRFLPGWKVNCGFVIAWWWISVFSWWKVNCEFVSVWWPLDGSGSSVVNCGFVSRVVVDWCQRLLESELQICLCVLAS